MDKNRIHNYNYPTITDQKYFPSKGILYPILLIFFNDSITNNQHLYYNYNYTSLFQVLVQIKRLATPKSVNGLLALNPSPPDIVPSSSFLPWEKKTFKLSLTFWITTK